MTSQEAKYLALDLETTGLSPDVDYILEYCAIALDEDLVPISPGTETGIVSDSPLSGLSPFVDQMHTENGLLRDIERGLGRPLARCEDLLLDLVDCHFPHRKPILLGSSVHFDRSFLRVHMPQLEARLHHRHVDTNTLRELGLMPPPTWSRPAHRAREDILASIRIIREYMKTCET